VNQTKLNNEESGNLWEVRDISACLRKCS